MEGDRKFGGCPSVVFPLRDVSANMQVTAKQIRYNGNENNKIIRLKFQIER